MGSGKAAGAISGTNTGCATSDLEGKTKVRLFRELNMRTVFMYELRCVKEG